KTLEFDKILELLAENALSEAVKTRCHSLTPSLNEAEARRWMDETTQARRILEQAGTPPLSPMTELQKVIGLVEADAMLIPEQMEHVLSFLAACRRMRAYLKRAEATDLAIAWYGGAIDPLGDLETELVRCIRGGALDDRASDHLGDIRRQRVAAIDQIKAKLEALLRKNKVWFSESFISMRGGHYTLPVKREHKNDVSGTMVEVSNTGGTCFIEPTSVGRLQSELYALEVEEDSEVRRILYALTALISDSFPALKRNVEAMQTLDFLFAKGKLSLAMQARPVDITTDRRICLVGARHPLLEKTTAVPLNFTAGGAISGVVITGPNTGGKTVTLKTVGLLSLMAQSGLHLPVDAGSSLCMYNLVLCDVGDGQSISENLSTFSAHIKNVLDILGQATGESLVLLDELGSGTDPVEGMGIAVAILDALCAKGCLFAVTTHYPEIKAYAANTPGLVNARMAFDRESLRPLYRLEIGEAGESCALYIAERLGMPTSMLKRAREAAYSKQNAEGLPVPQRHQNLDSFSKAAAPKIVRQKANQNQTPRCDTFQIGDSVLVYPAKETGIIYARANDLGEVGVQVKGVKKMINHKRIKLQVAASQLYPADYDFSILFDTVENRKARRILERRHQEGNMIVIKEGESEL
ncbi:MAG TPA: DNA mismatch repair protein MutS, partial [Clostridia bacterium]|nr:DNA mismatch repair protein MutS [Clostridia bacterium]